LTLSDDDDDDEADVVELRAPVRTPAPAPDPAAASSSPSSGSLTLPPEAMQVERTSPEDPGEKRGPSGEVRRRREAGHMMAMPQMMKV
jgi:hypothetical protein